jgi:protein-tyrosine-phosphatase
MIVHFVCRGNTFRSRLAEAYFNSLKLPGYLATSSGIEASRDLDGAICFYTKEIANEHGLADFLSEHWIQASKELLEKADIVVFIDHTVEEQSLRELKPELARAVAWNLYDVDPLSEKTVKTRTANDIFALIKQKTDELVATLKKK